MKLTLNRTTFLKSLARVKTVVETRNTIPILSNIKLALCDDTLTITATDLDITAVDVVRDVVVDDASGPDAITVPAHTLHDIVRKMPDGAQIGLETIDDGARITVKSGRSRFVLQALAADDFPDLSQINANCTFRILAKTLVECHGQVKFAISTEETRYYLNGIYWHVNGEHLTFVATDGHRLARCNIDVPAGAETLPPIIVPRKTVAELDKLLRECADSITISASTSFIRFQIGDMLLQSKLIDGTYPDYNRVIPSNGDKTAIVAGPELSAATARVTAIATERGRAVKLSFSDGLVRLSSVNPDCGSAEDEVRAEYSGDPVDVGFNGSYLAEIIATLDSPVVCLQVRDPMSPALITAGAGDDHALLIVLMPMRVH